MNPQTAERTSMPRLYLTPADHGQRLTREQFESANAQEGYRYELIHGRLDVSPLPDKPHERLRQWLKRLLDDYAATRSDVINEVSSPARLFLPAPPEEVTAPEPDIVCYRDYPQDIPEDDMNWEHGTPILAVEIISEDTAGKDLERNLALYLQVPTIREYWIIDPREESHSRPSMTVYRRGQRWQKPIEVPAGGTYTTRLLPGFVLNLDRRPQD
jgi:Uma2 family endonuclease